ncbi:tumor necrosis factor receptor superfamily member 4 [Embiotoca jacksoni]|uniref:tumor necrosis factor receptor superfamily member 4 n=1 Tax=Embiotoca jacksoni TaxID=100190 RepID=UPI003703714D
MGLLKQLVFILMLMILIADLDARTCPKGSKITGNGCEPCTEGYYQPVENDSQQCKPCTVCYNKMGSVAEQSCTKTTNTKCQCRGKSVPGEQDSSTCKCKEGFGLKEGECEECEDGYFNKVINMPCQKWKDCKSAGVKVNGTKTSDVICDELKTITHMITTSTMSKIVSLTRLTTHRPRGGAQTQKMHTVTTTAAPKQTIWREETLPSAPSNVGNHNGVTLVIGVLVFIGLLVLTAVTCWLHNTSSWQKKTTVQTTDSFYRRPVEESGDGSASSLKLNPHES